MWDALIGQQLPYLQVELAFDHEHRHLNDLISEMHHQLVNAAPVSEQLIALHNMEAFLRVNSLSEESVMDECAFPLSRAHKEEHRAHCEAVRAIEANIRDSRTTEALGGLMALHQTLLNHIREKDQEIVDWKHRQTDMRYSA